jgi:putative ABC transport system permease protein
MKTVRAFFVRFAGWFRKGRREQEMMDEFDSHLQLHIDENLRSGMSPQEARRQALLRFGGMEAAKESMRSRGSFLWLETCCQDVRYALRGLHRNPGLDASNVLTFRVTLPYAPYPGSRQRAAFFLKGTQELARLPGVRSVSAINYLPFNGEAAGTYVSVAGHPRSKPGEDMICVIRTVLPGYFKTMGIPILRGRDFTSADNDPSTPYRFIVSEAFVRKYLPDVDPLDARISTLMEENDNPFGQIIGVAGDVKEGSLDKEPDPTVYYISAHLPDSEMVFVVRTENDPLLLASTAARVIHSIDPQQPIMEARGMEQVVRQTFARQQFSATLLAGFSLASLLLAAVGVYGLLAYSVSQRTREIGVRIALGAEPGRILLMIVGEGAQLVLAGAVTGLAGALALSGMLKSLLFATSPAIRQALFWRR